jgi:hypothetical protein
VISPGRGRGVGTLGFTSGLEVHACHAIAYCD